MTKSELNILAKKFSDSLFSDGSPFLDFLEFADLPDTFTVTFETGSLHISLGFNAFYDSKSIFVTAGNIKGHLLKIKG